MRVWSSNIRYAGDTPRGGVVARDVRTCAMLRVVGPASVRMPRPRLWLTLAISNVAQLQVGPSIQVVAAVVARLS